MGADLLDEAKESIRLQNQAFSGRDKFAQIKAYVIDTQRKDRLTFESKEAIAQKVSLDESRQRRKETLQASRDNLKPDRVMVLPDEISDDDSKESDTELVVFKTAINFGTFKFKLEKKREVYKMKPQKLVGISCGLCKLLVDYNKVCSHYDLETPEKQQAELNRLMANRGLDRREMYSSLF